ncbi:MAG: YolD-like family protein [Oscillospiraceae bacterium]
MGSVRVPMPPAKRAKIFSMYDALKGFKEALAAKEIIPEERKFLAEDRIEELNRSLLDLRKGSTVTVVYYCTLERCYRQITGPVTKLDSYWKYLQIGEVCIDLDVIYEVVV